MEIVQENDFIISNKGEIRGRKNLVKEIANSSFSDRISLPTHSKYLNNYQIKWKGKKPNVFGNQQLGNILPPDYNKANDGKFKNQEYFEFLPNRNKHNFTVNTELTQIDYSRENFGDKIKPKTFNFTSVVSTEKPDNEAYNIVNKNFKYFPRPNLGISNKDDSVDKVNIFRNDLPEQTSTDFGYLNYITQTQKLNEKQRDIGKSQKHYDFYANNYVNLKSSQNSHRESNEKKLFFAKNGEKRESCINSTDDSKNTNDNLMASKYELSRNSSTRSFNKMLPVGKFAKQKFHVVQDEEELVDRPVIYDLNGLPILNLEITNEFDCIAESVSININKLTNVEVVVNILVNKYIRKRQSDKIWTKKRIEITREISINVDASGKKEKVEKLIHDSQNNENVKYSIKTSIYRLKGEKIQFSGHQAFKIFKTLMKIAENWKTDESTNCHAKYRFTPLYLLAVLGNPDSSCFPHY